MAPRRALIVLALSLLPACKGGGNTDALQGTWTCKSNDGGSGETIVIAGDKLTRKYAHTTMEGTFTVAESKGERTVIDVVLDMKDGKKFKADQQELVLSDDGAKMSIKNVKNGSGADCTRG